MYPWRPHGHHFISDSGEVAAFKRPRKMNVCAVLLKQGGASGQKLRLKVTQARFES